MKTWLNLAVMLTFLPNVSEAMGSRAHPRVLRIGTFSKAFSYAPLYVAKNSRWLETEPDLKGAKVEFIEFNDRPTISAALTAGSIDALFSAEVPAILCRAQGNDIRIWGVSSTAVQRVLVRSKLDFKEISALRGKRIAVLPATSSHYCLLQLLKGASLEEQDVDLAYMTPPEARAAFESGAIDAWAVWAPFAEYQEVSGLGIEIGGDGALIHSVISFRGAFVNESSGRKFAAAVIRTIGRAKTWISVHKEESLRIVSNEIGIPMPVSSRAWDKFRWNVELDSAMLDDIQKKADFLADADKTRQSKRIDVRADLLVPAPR